MVRGRQYIEKGKMVRVVGLFDIIQNIYVSMSFRKRISSNKADGSL